MVSGSAAINIAAGALATGPAIGVGLLVGVASPVQANSFRNLNFEQATIQPAVDFSRLQIVLIITNFRAIDTAPLAPTTTP